MHHNGEGVVIIAPSWGARDIISINVSIQYCIVRLNLSKISYPEESGPNPA